jgi:hypothetical protein
MDGGEVIDQLPVHSVVVSREDGLWVAVVQGLAAGATDVERCAELPGAVRDLIATLLDVEPDASGSIGTTVRGITISPI